MLLTHLSLTNFRNFARLDIDVPGGPVLLVGGNAQGKTSLLESVYYLATFTSFHATQDRQLVSFLAASEPLVVTRITADFQYNLENTALTRAKNVPQSASQGAAHRLEVRLISERDLAGEMRLRKEILLDGVARKVGEAIGAFNAVLFLPHMLRIVEGAPEERRRYLNLSLGQVMPRYAADLAEYLRLLTQRNALLKLLNERGSDPGQLTYWDEQLAELGARIIHARIHALRELERLAARLHHELTRGQEVLRLDYQPSYDPLPAPPPTLQGQYALPMDAPVDRSGQSIEKIRQGFLNRLEQLRLEEIQRGVTTIGPHRDELRFLGNGIDLGVYGSRGQGRTAVLAFKLAEVIWMKQKSGQMPVLLLDEVLAELDPDRRSDLIQRVLESEQALMTTTDLDSFPSEFLAKAPVWQIAAGQVILPD
jgi:DNA replication and repair protein RecF